MCFAEINIFYDYFRVVDKNSLQAKDEHIKDRDWKKMILISAERTSQILGVLEK